MSTRTRRRLRTADCPGLRVVSPGDCMSVFACVLGALLLCACLSAQTRLGISRADWGTTVRGEKVAIYTLVGAGGLEARISNFGGVVVTLNVPNRNGLNTDVMLGY